MVVETAIDMKIVKYRYACEGFYQCRFNCVSFFFLFHISHCFLYYSSLRTFRSVKPLAAKVGSSVTRIVSLGLILVQSKVLFQILLVSFNASNMFKVS